MRAVWFLARTLSTGTLTAKPFLLAVLLFALAQVSARAGRRRLAAALNIAIIAGVILSVLFVGPRPLPAQPYPDAREIADTTKQLASGNGYVTYLYENEPRPPMYPPGFSLALFPFAAAAHDYPANVQRGAVFYAALYVLIVAMAAMALQGPAAGAVMALLIGISPFARVEASLILSDALGAGLTVLLVILLRHATPSREYAAGFLAGTAVVVRLPLVVNLVALFVVMRGAARKRMLACAALPLVALALFQWRTYGSMFTTGYHYWNPAAKFFSGTNAVTSPMPGDGPWIIPDVLGGLLLRAVCPCPPGGPQAAMSNLAYYSSVLAGLFWLFVPPLVPWIGFIAMWQHRQTRPVQFAACVIAASFLLFIFYNYQGARFMAGAVTLLGVFAAAAIAQWLAPAETHSER